MRIAFVEAGPAQCFTGAPKHCTSLSTLERYLQVTRRPRRLGLLGARRLRRRLGLLGHGERPRLYLLFKEAGTESSSTLAVTVLAVRTFPLPFRPLYSVTHAIYGLRLCVPTLHGMSGSCTRSLRAFLGQRVGEASHPGPRVPEMPAPPPEAEPVAPGAERCFRTVEGRWVTEGARAQSSRIKQEVQNTCRL